MAILYDAIEPVAAEVAKLNERTLTIGEVATISTAISLKRIADILETGVTPGTFVSLENLAWAMGQAFERGKRTA